MPSPYLFRYWLLCYSIGFPPIFTPIFFCFLSISFIFWIDWWHEASLFSAFSYFCCSRFILYSDYWLSDNLMSLEPYPAGSDTSNCICAINTLLFLSSFMYTWNSNVIFLSFHIAVVTPTSRSDSQVILVLLPIRTFLPPFRTGMELPWVYSRPPPTRPILLLWIICIV